MRWRCKDFEKKYHGRSPEKKGLTNSKIIKLPPSDPARTLNDPLLEPGRARLVHNIASPASQSAELKGPEIERKAPNKADDKCKG